MFRDAFLTNLLLLLLAKDLSAEDQHVHVCGHETPVCFLRRADDRLTANVETGVDHDRAFGLVIEGPHQLVQQGIPL